MDGSQLSFNTFIYEYFLKLGHYDIARAVIKENKFRLRTTKDVNPSTINLGGSSSTSEIWNTDSAIDDLPEDLPVPVTMEPGPGKGFLFEWFSIFSDLYAAHNSSVKRNIGQMTQAANYLMLNRSLSLQALEMSSGTAALSPVVADNTLPVGTAANFHATHLNSGPISCAEATTLPPEIQKPSQKQRSTGKMQFSTLQGLPDLGPTQRSNTVAKRQFTASDDSLPTAKKQRIYHKSLYLDECSHIVPQAVTSTAEISAAGLSPLAQSSPGSSHAQSIISTEPFQSVSCGDNHFLHNSGHIRASTGKNAASQRINVSDLTAASPAFSKKGPVVLESPRAEFSDHLHELEIMEVSSHEDVPNQMPASELGRSLPKLSSPPLATDSDFVAGSRAASVNSRPSSSLCQDFYWQWHPALFYYPFHAPENYSFKVASTDTDPHVQTDLTELNNADWEAFSVPTSDILFPTCV